MAGPRHSRGRPSSGVGRGEERRRRQQAAGEAARHRRRHRPLPGQRLARPQRQGGRLHRRTGSASSRSPATSTTSGPLARSRQALATVSVIIERLPVSIASDPFNRPILQGLEAAARRHGYRVAMEFVGPEDHPDIGHWAQVRRPASSSSAAVTSSPGWVQAAADSAIPVVMVDHVVPGLDLPAVVSDNLAGAHAMTRYLLEMGHRRIGFIRGPSKYWTLSERLAGFMLALQQAGVWPDQNLMPPRVSHSEEKGYGEMLLLLDLPEPPTAVVAVSDKAAVGAYRACTRARPVDPAMTSRSSDSTTSRSARALNPPLTTVHVPGEEMGRVSFERLRHLIEGDEPRSPARLSGRSPPAWSSEDLLRVVLKRRNWP